MLDIYIDGKKYEYSNSVKIDDKNYIAYSDGSSIYISEFYYENDEIVLKEIDDDTLSFVKGVMS